MAEKDRLVTLSNRLSILAVEPYYGGSHRAVLDGLVARIDADWTLLTLPPRKWKWRMRGAAITLADELNARPAGDRGRGFDLVFASTFINLCEFFQLSGGVLQGVPSILYFHENQLVYPNRHLAEWDFQFPLTNITSALAVDSCVFNSEWNRDRFLEEIPGFIKNFPDALPKNISERIARKSEVLAPPFDTADFDAVSPVRSSRTRIVWPHRWEHDKNPEEFVQAIDILASEGLDFEVVFAGQVFRDVPEAISQALDRMGDRVVMFDAPGDRAKYARLLRSCDIAVSTAHNEFFGIAMMEAAYAGCYCVVPDRVAYPEHYPTYHRYSGVGELVELLRRLVTDRPTVGSLSSYATGFTFESLVPSYVDLFYRVSGIDRSPASP